MSLTGEWALEELANLAPGETKEFPPSLSSFQRLVLHRLAERLGWEHESRDVEVRRAPPGRQIFVTRPRKGAPLARNMRVAPEDFLPPLHPPGSSPPSRTTTAESEPARAQGSSAPSRSGESR